MVGTRIVHCTRREFLYEIKLFRDLPIAGRYLLDYFRYGAMNSIICIYNIASFLRLMPQNSQVY
jgi:hypothetical protein